MFSSRRFVVFSIIALILVLIAAITWLPPDSRIRPTFIPSFNDSPQTPLAPVTPPNPTPQVIILLAKDKPQDRHGDLGFGDDWHDMAISSRTAYAKTWGHTFHWSDISQFDSFKIRTYWGRISALLDAFDRFPEAEWVWMLDSDAVIMNCGIDIWTDVLSPKALEKNVRRSARIWFGGWMKTSSDHREIRTPKIVVPEDVYLVIAQDQNGINAGSFAVRRNGFMEAFLSLWLDPFFTKQAYSFVEQDVLSHLIINHPRVAKHVGIVPQRLINAYPWTEGYEPTDFVAHFAGCKTFRKDCDKLFRAAWANRTVCAGEE